MKKLSACLLTLLHFFLFSCTKNNSGPGQQNPQTYPVNFFATTRCTTYNSNGSILQVGSPYTYTVTMKVSTKPNFDLHLLNFTGDADTSVHATNNAPSGIFSIPLQNFTTSNGTNLQISGQGSRTTDSLIYSWSFYMAYKSHDCTCKAKKF